MRVKSSVSASRPWPRKAHSQTTCTRQPCFSRASMFFSSFLAFRSSFSRQNFPLLFGQLNMLHSCLCQKHPLIMITARYLGNTRSGFPGRSLACSLYRKPLAWSAFRTTNSGLVFFPRIEDIIRLRVAGSTISFIQTGMAAGRRMTDAS